MRKEEYSSKDLDHFRIVSAMYDEIDLVNTMDRLIPQDPRAILTTGVSLRFLAVGATHHCLSLRFIVLAFPRELRFH